jgi:DNA invertase Pin-like site-specific DNA recombinase
LRVSTTDQDVGRQERELRAVATARGYTIADDAVYCDHQRRQCDRAFNLGVWRGVIAG